jgi:predicted dehydrogenase
MRIDFRGKLVDQPEIRAGFIGCGSHSFRNVYPTFQFAPVNLVATCDLQLDKAQAFATKFGASAAYADYREMLAKEQLDAVFIVTGYDKDGRPLYPPIAADCIRAGCHVWMEKPPAATCKELEDLQKVAGKAGVNVMVGMKKMFFPANEKAAQLMREPEFGQVSLATFQYPQYVPTVEEMAAYMRGERVEKVVGFLDHLCHPVSLMLFLLGMPRTLYYERSSSGAGLAMFTFASGAAATLVLTHGAARDGGMERTLLVGDKGSHIVVDNNIRVTYYRNPPYEPGTGYGAAPNYYTGGLGDATVSWEPEFSLGQLYNKALFLLGYYGEVNEFARSILEKRPPAKAHLEHAWQATRIFEAFAEGGGKVIPLRPTGGASGNCK